MGKSTNPRIVNPKSARIPTISYGYTYIYICISSVFHQSSGWFRLVLYDQHWHICQCDNVTKGKPETVMLSGRLVHILLNLGAILQGPS